MCNYYVNKINYSNIHIHTGTGCQPESDGVWGIEWQFAYAGTRATGKCPGLSESSGT